MYGSVTHEENCDQCHQPGDSNIAVDCRGTCSIKSHQQWCRPCRETYFAEQAFDPTMRLPCPICRGTRQLDAKVLLQEPLSPTFPYLWRWFRSDCLWIILCIVLQFVFWVPHWGAHMVWVDDDESAAWLVGTNQILLSACMTDLPLGICAHLSRSVCVSPNACRIHESSCVGASRAGLFAIHHLLYVLLRSGCSAARRPQHRRHIRMGSGLVHRQLNSTRPRTTAGS